MKTKFLIAVVFFLAFVTTANAAHALEVAAGASNGLSTSPSLTYALVAALVPTVAFLRVYLGARWPYWKTGQGAAVLTMMGALGASLADAGGQLDNATLQAALAVVGGGTVVWSVFRPVLSDGLYWLAKRSPLWLSLYLLAPLAAFLESPKPASNS